MLSKQKLKNISALHQKKFRMQEGLFIAEGIKTINDLINSDIRIIELYYTTGLAPLEILELQQAGLPIEEIAEKDMERISALQSPADILAVCAIPHAKTYHEKDAPITLILDGIRDPGNLGTIIRIAAWFGIKHIICSSDTAEYTNPKCIQASMGTFALVNLIYTNLSDFIKANALSCYAATMEGENIYKHKIAPPITLVIGSESHGISPEILKLCKNKIAIPAHPNETKTDSLNAAVATAMLCSEINRQIYHA